MLLFVIGVILSVFYIFNPVSCLVEAITATASRFLPFALLPLASHKSLEMRCLQQNCAIVPLIVIRPMMGTIPFFSLFPFT